MSSGHAWGSERVRQTQELGYIEGTLLTSERVRQTRELRVQNELSTVYDGQIKFWGSH